MKPIMNIDVDKDVDSYAMIQRAGSILSANGYRQEAKDIHQRASVEGYDFYQVLRLLKEYFTI